MESLCRNPGDCQIRRHRRSTGDDRPVLETSAAYQLGLYAEAVNDAQLSLKADPTQPSPYCVLAKALAKQNQTAAAKQTWLKLAELPPDAAALPLIEPDCLPLAREVLNEH